MEPVLPLCFHEDEQHLSGLCSKALPHFFCNKMFLNHPIKACDRFFSSIFQTTTEQMQEPHLSSGKTRGLQSSRSALQPRLDADDATAKQTKRSTETCQSPREQQMAAPALPPAEFRSSKFLMFPAAGRDVSVDGDHTETSHAAPRNWRAEADRILMKVRSHRKRQKRCSFFSIYGVREHQAAVPGSNTEEKRLGPAFPCYVSKHS